MPWSDCCYWFVEKLQRLILTNSKYSKQLKYLSSVLLSRWIEGFLSKEETERKLKSAKHQKQGLFLLRFSDWSLDSTQTKDAIYGKIATSVLVKSELMTIPTALCSIKKSMQANV